ncbi:hypothetical protein SUGI_0532240 [Cryptomeria japonica]|nr:hypothetical protein SUGI_0532240 [Cryptomeria japonica]
MASTSESPSCYSPTEQIQSQSLTVPISARLVCLSCKGNVAPADEWMFSIEDDHFDRSGPRRPVSSKYKSSSVKRISGLGRKAIKT